MGTLTLNAFWTISTGTDSGSSAANGQAVPRPTSHGRASHPERTLAFSASHAVAFFRQSLKNGSSSFPAASDPLVLNAVAPTTAPAGCILSPTSAETTFEALFSTLDTIPAGDPAAAPVADGKAGAEARGDTVAASRALGLASRRPGGPEQKPLHTKLAGRLRKGAGEGGALPAVWEASSEMRTAAGKALMLPEWMLAPPEDLGQGKAERKKDGRVGQTGSRRAG